MPSSRSCIVKEYPVPNREYRAAPPSRWDTEVSGRPAPSRRAPRRRHSRLLPSVLMGLLLFTGGFLLGRAAAAAPEADTGGPIQNVQADQPAVRIFGVIGAQTSGAASAAGGTSAPASGVTGARPSGTDSAPGGSVPAPASGESEEWYLRLVNGDHPLPEDFAVPELTRLKNGHAIDSRAYPELQAMMDAARAAGYQPLICSSYRTWDKQSELFENKVASCLTSASSRAEAEAQAAVWVARPGTSEHQLGLAVDIVDKEYQLLDQAQENRPVQQWLMAHCAEYGFILRYPTGKSDITAIGYEPWHYRYVGKAAAQAIMSAGICLEEYLAG